MKRRNNDVAPAIPRIINIGRNSGGPNGFKS